MKSNQHYNTTTKIMALKKYFPITLWLPKYQSKFFIPDIVAGLTVGLTAIPQAIAYAAIAGLEPQYGLNSAFMGCFAYLLFGSCKDITIGPTAIMSLMIQSHALKSPDYAILSCFLSGCLILLMALFNLGTLVKFISMPVTTGFTMAAAITIASGQINNLFGIPTYSNTFISSWTNLYRNFQDAKFNDSILGITTLIMLLMLKKLGTLSSKGNCRLLKYISLARNALAVILGILLCYNLKTSENKLPFRVGKKIVAGLPSFQLPPFETYISISQDYDYDRIHSYQNSLNETITKVYFDEMVKDLGTSLITIPLICILESITIAKAFSKGNVVNANQEMIALGFSNILGGFVSSMPVTGSFTRSAINNASGVRTPLGGILTGSLVLLTLLFLTQTFYYLPKTTLAAIIISAMWNMLNDYQHVYDIWKSKKTDIIPFFVTVFLSLFWSLEYGILSGIFINLLFIIKIGTKLNIEIYEQHQSDNQHNPLWIVEICGNLCYASAEHCRNTIVKYVTNKLEHQHKEIILKNGTTEHIDNNCPCDSQMVVVLKGHNINEIDATVAQNIFALQEDLSVLGCQLICWEWNKSTRDVLYGMNPIKSKKILRDSSNSTLFLPLEPTYLTQLLIGNKSSTEIENKV